MGEWSAVPVIIQSSVGYSSHCILWGFCSSQNHEISCLHALACLCPVYGVGHTLNPGKASVTFHYLYVIFQVCNVSLKFVSTSGCSLIYHHGNFLLFSGSIAIPKLCDKLECIIRVAITKIINIRDDSVNIKVGWFVCGQCTQYSVWIIRNQFPLYLEIQMNDVMFFEHQWIKETGYFTFF